jgi:hypothetical protein
MTLPSGLGGQERPPLTFALQALLIRHEAYVAG